MSFDSTYLPVLYRNLSTNNINLMNDSCLVSLLEYYPFSAGQVAAISAINSVTTYGSSTMSAIMNVNNVINRGGGSFIIGSAIAAQMIQLNRFVYTTYPPNLLILFNSSVQEVVSTSLPIHINTAQDSNNASQNSSDSITDGSKFEFYEITPSVFKGGYSQLITLGILLAILLICTILRRIKSCSLKTRKIFFKIENFIRWNYILMSITTSSTKFYLFVQS